jgi:hypothetical protein
LPTYRCFCLTVDNRIITGAYIDAKDVWAAVDAARQLWELVPRFRTIEVWDGFSRMWPPVTPDR